MKIALCNGGLGNQTFQYIFSRFIELEGGEPCYLDNAAFWGGRVAHNGFEIPNVFPYAQPRLLSECFSEDVWRYMVSEGGIPQQLRNAGEDYTIVAEMGDFQYDGNVIPVPANQYTSCIAHARGKIYYHGYWINKGWLVNRHEETLRRELQFAPLTDDRNKRYEEQIEETQSMALHVRRGDFLQCHWDAPLECYQAAVRVMKEQVENVHFFLFSDDMAWCRENREAMGLESDEVTFVEGNVKGENYKDMQLMSYCKGIILANTSSFSYLAALLNRNARFKVFNMTDREV